MNEDVSRPDLTGWIPVLVRDLDYQLVTELVAAREAERKGGEHLTRELPESPGDIDPRLVSWPAWPIEALRRLSDSNSTTAQRWALAMDSIATASDGRDWYTTSEVAGMTGMSINQWRDAPRKITRHLAAHYKDVPTDESGHHVWPLRAGGRKGDTEVSWGMPPANKTRWLAIRGLAKASD